MVEGLVEQTTLHFRLLGTEERNSHTRHKSLHPVLSHIITFNADVHLGPGLGNEA